MDLEQSPWFCLSVCFFHKARRVFCPAQLRAFCPWFQCQGKGPSCARQAWTNPVKNALNLTLHVPDSPLWPYYHLCITVKIHYVLIISSVYREHVLFPMYLLFFPQISGRQSSFIKLFRSYLFQYILKFFITNYYFLIQALLGWRTRVSIQQMGKLRESAQKMPHFFLWEK